MPLAKTPKRGMNRRLPATLLRRLQHLRCKTLEPGPNAGFASRSSTPHQGSSPGLDLAPSHVTTSTSRVSVRSPSHGSVGREQKAGRRQTDDDARPEGPSPDGAPTKAASPRRPEIGPVSVHRASPIVRVGGPSQGCEGAPPVAGPAGAADGDGDASARGPSLRSGVERTGCCIHFRDPAQSFLLRTRAHS